MKKAVIIGGGRIGSRLAEALSRENYEVILLEKDKEVAERLSKEIDALVLNVDALDRRALKEIDLSDVDVAIAATGDDKTNILVCEIMKRQGVRHVIARVTEPENYDIFLGFDITAINESAIIVDAMLKSIHAPYKGRLVATINDTATIIKYVVGERSSLLNKHLKESFLKRNVFCISRNGEVIIPDEKTTLRDGDVLYLIVSNKDLPKVTKFIEEEHAA